MSKLMKGAFILTAATAVSKILGFIYVVPFVLLVGARGNILFEYGYKPYILILSLATLGVPLAVSKFVSKYNELGDFRAGYRLFKFAIAFSLAAGCLCFVLLYAAAPNIASLLIDSSDKTGNAAKDVIFVVRMVSFALIIVPPMAVARGFFQGYQNMKPTAYSQIVEQLLRIIFVLLSCYVCARLYRRPVYVAVGFATFGAFVGALGGAFVLWRYWLKEKSAVFAKVESSAARLNLSNWRMLAELAFYAVPFVLVNLSIPFYQSIDTFTVNRALMSAGSNQADAEFVNSLISLAQKVILIPVSLASAFGATLLPVITASYARKEMPAVRASIEKSLSVVLFATLPCCLFLMMFGSECFRFLFGAIDSTSGGFYLAAHAPIAALFSVYILSSSTLQGMDRHKFAVFSLLLGVIVKYALNNVLLVNLGGSGAVAATALGFALSIGLNIWGIQKAADFRVLTFLKSSAKALIPMFAACVSALVLHVCGQAFLGSVSSYLQNLLELSGYALAFFGVYLGVSAKLGLLSNYFRKNPS